MLRFALVAAFAAAAGCSATGPDAPVEARVDAEIERLLSVADSLAGDALPEAVRGGLDPVAGQLAAAGPGVALPLRLYRLREPFVRVETLAWMADHPEAGEDLARLEALWRELESELATEPGPVDGPPLLVALAQRAANRSGRLYRAALPYGKVSSPVAGLYYLGEALGERRFHTFVAALPAPVAGGGAVAPLDGAALEEALERLESETVDAFAAERGSGAMVPVSARLKEARELLEDGSLDGAALVLLESRLELSRRTGGASEGGGPAVAPPAAGDWSLAAPFLALAAAEPDGDAGSIVRTELVPFYTALRESRR